MALEQWNGLMVENMTGHGKMDYLMDRVNYKHHNILMLVIGSKGNHIIEVFIHGQMEDVMMDFIIWEKSKVLVLIDFMMVKFMKGNGEMVSNMV